LTIQVNQLRCEISKNEGDETSVCQTRRTTYHAITYQVRRRIGPYALGEKGIVFRSPLLSDVLIRHLPDLYML
jgi:hypothetical protein